MTERLRCVACGWFCALVLLFAQVAEEQVVYAQQTPAVRAEERALAAAQAAAEAQQRTDEKAFVLQLGTTQRPSTLDCKLPGPPPADQPPLRLDAYGNLKDPFGTESRPFYLYWDTLRIVVPPGTDGGVLQARITTTPPTEPMPITTIPGKISVGGIEHTRELSLTRAQLRGAEKGGVVKIDIEVQLEPHEMIGALVGSVFLILEKPWTVVLSETGPVDPRFKSPPAPVYLPCDPAFRYAPTKPELASAAAPVPILKHASPFVFNPGDVKPIEVRVRVPRTPDDLTIVPWTELQTDSENKQADLLIERQGTAIALTSLTREAKPGFKAQTPREENGDTVYEVSLDRTGITSWPYLNRRRPPLLSFVTDAFLEFTNSLSDRQFVVTFAGIPEANRAELVRFGLKVTDCRDARCKASVQVAPGSGQARVPLRGLRDTLAKGESGGLVSFTVSFFDDDVTPSNSTGYFTFVDEQNFREGGSVTAWSTGMTLTIQRDPDLSTFNPPGMKAAAIDFAHPLAHMNRTHVTGSATIGIKQQLGGRADAEVELVAKKGDFGFDSGGVGASKYLATIYALNGATLTGGRVDLAAPTNSISIAESGEAVNVAFRIPKMHWLGRVNVARIIRKELPDGSFTSAEIVKATAAGTVLEKDHGAILAQFRDLTFGSRYFRASLYGVLGEAKRGHVVDPANPTTSELTRYEVDYWSTGADMTLSYRHLLLTGGLYANKRWSDDAPEAAAPAIAKSGNVGLATMSYTNIDKGELEQGRQEVDWIASASIGGGGDYVGETQAFAPDLLFLSTLAPALKETSYPIGSGLTNKWYFGGAISTPQSFQWIKDILRPVSPSARDISASSVSFKLHHYLRRYASAGSRSLGTEGDFEFRIETPKGVRFQLIAAAFKPGEALTAPVEGQALISTWQYALKLGMTIRLE
jgi:hypothetical protein